MSPKWLPGILLGPGLSSKKVSAGFMIERIQAPPYFSWSYSQEFDRIFGKENFHIGIWSKEERAIQENHHQKVVCGVGEGGRR